MNIQLTAGQQHQLIELYQNLQSDSVTIQMNSSQITVQTSLGLSTIEVPNVEQTKRWMNRYINNACDPDIDFDADIFAANDLVKFLKIGIDTDKTYSQQILALSYAWDKVLEKKICDNIPIVKIQHEMKNILNRNTKRLFEIAQRANELLKTIGDFPPPKFLLLTPHWLHSLPAPEWKRFIQGCKKEKERLAGAQL